jgi:hypothetical protein
MTALVHNTETGFRTKGTETRMQLKIPLHRNNSNGTRLVNVIPKENFSMFPINGGNFNAVGLAISPI